MGGGRSWAHGRVPDRVADQTVMNDSRQPADLGWEELGKESLCGGRADIDDGDDSCCVLSRIHNRFFVCCLTEFSMNSVKYYTHFIDEETLREVK